MRPSARWCSTGLLLVVATGCGMHSAGRPSPAAVGSAPHAAVAASVPRASPAALLGSRPATLDALRREQGHRPVSLLLPREKDAASIEVRTTDPVSGGLDLPADAATVAWWGSGSAPGDGAGSVVLAAHVSYRGTTGPFTRLAGLRRGETVIVTSADGGAHRYVVDIVRSAPKTALDREALFRTTGGPALALVTCGGTYDASTHSYDSNTIVIAQPVNV